VSFSCTLRTLCVSVHWLLKLFIHYIAEEKRDNKLLLWWSVCACFSEAESARLSSVVLSADDVKAASLPLQVNSSVSDKLGVSCNKKTKKKKHKRTRPANSCNVSSSVNEPCDSVDDSSCISNQSISNRSHKQKLRIQAEVCEVKKSGSNDSCNTVDSVSDRCSKVKDSGCKNKSHKRKNKETSESFDLCDSVVVKRKKTWNVFKVGMLTRLARLETRTKFSVSSIEFLAVEKCDKQLDRRRRSFNDGRYANPPAGGLRVSWESVTRVCSLDGN